MEIEDKESQILVMDEEIVSPKNIDTWNLVPLPNGRKPRGCKWEFKINIGSYESVKKYKSRLVEKGYSHLRGYTLVSFLF